MKVTVILLLAGLLNAFLFVIVHQRLVLHVAGVSLRVEADGGNDVGRCPDSRGNPGFSYLRSMALQHKRYLPTQGIRLGPKVRKGHGGELECDGRASCSCARERKTLTTGDAPNLNVKTLSFNFAHPHTG